MDKTEPEKKGPGFDLKATNFKFGKDPMDYNTTNKEEHGWKEPDLKSLNNTKDMVDQLRCNKKSFNSSAHHYELGNDNPNYQTEHTQHFDGRKAKPIDKSGFQDPYKDNFSIKHKSGQSANPYTSEYKEEIGDGQDPNKTKNIGAAGYGDNKPDNQISSVLFGTDPTKTGTTEHNDQ